MNWENELKGMELFIKKTNEYIKSKETVPMSVIEDIKADISSYKDDKVIHAERNEMINIVLEIIDKHIGTCDSCNNPCVMYKKGMKGCGKE